MILSVKLGPEGTSRALVSSPVPFPDREYSESDDGVWSVALAVTRVSSYPRIQYSYSRRYVRIGQLGERVFDLEMYPDTIPSPPGEQIKPTRHFVCLKSGQPGPFVPGATADETQSVDGHLLI